jgi:polar amino acid transport system substrate-binding protein
MNKNENMGKPVRRLLPLVLAMAACAGAWGMEVRVAAQEALAPKWILLPDRVTGICPDIMAAVEKLEPRLRFTGYRRSRSLPGIEAGLESGSLDAACALIASPRRRAIALQAGKPVYVTRHLLVARTGDQAVIRDVHDLARTGALVTSHRGSVFTEQLKAAGVRVDDATDDNGVNLHKMLAGHGRFAYINELTLRHYLRREQLDAKVRVLPVVLGAALDKLKANGELERIYARWAGTP